MSHKVQCIDSGLILWSWLCGLYGVGSDGNNDQSMDDNELMTIYNSGRSMDTEEGMQVCTETLNQDKATISKCV